MFDSEFLTNIIYRLPGVIVGFSLHEFGHAYAAHKLGDPTPERDGRLTLSPKAHLDPLGVILLSIVGFGWAKPVIIHPRNFSNPKRDGMIVSLAGPLMNLVAAAIFILLMKLALISGIQTFLGTNVYQITLSMLYISAYFNVFMMFFNLLPLAPLDGFTVLAGILPVKYYRNIEFLAVHGQTILMVLIFASLLSDDYNIISDILKWPVRIVLYILSFIFRL